METELRIIVEFIGGPMDGMTVVGQAGEQDEAERYYVLTNHGRIGQRFHVASEYAIETLAREQLRDERPHHFQRHTYEVSDRLQEEDELLIRAVYVPKPSRRRPSEP